MHQDCIEYFWNIIKCCAGIDGRGVMRHIYGTTVVGEKDKQGKDGKVSMIINLFLCNLTYEVNTNYNFLIS